MNATSPLGKKGCECSYCGKILHNQGEDAHSVMALFILCFVALFSLSRLVSFGLVWFFVLISDKNSTSERLPTSL